MGFKVALATVLAVAGAASSAHAAVVLSDNFNAGTAGPNWSGDSVFISVPQPGNVQDLPSVDLVGPGYFSSLAYEGNSIDLDGSTGYGHSPDGELYSIMSLAMGTYTVSFYLAGNDRGYPSQTTTVSIGDESWAITPSNSSPYTPYTHTFVGASGQLSFVDTGPEGNSNQRGNLLDNVMVTSSVPEASTWVMMLAGFAGLGFAGFRARKGARLAQLG